MIHVVNGDLFENLKPHSIILHQTNCLGIANAGIAKLIRAYSPEWYEEYSQYCKQNISASLLGTFHTYDVLDSDIKICSAFGQYSIGKEQQQTDYNAWKKILPELTMQLDNRYNEGDVWTVRIPFGIGCGLGGGDWSIMRDLFMYYVRYSPVDFIFYKLPAKGI